MLDWREFEAFAAKIFESFGFITTRNYRLKKPTMEVDLLACKNVLAMVADCKRWKRTVGRANMTRVGERQIRRAERVASEGKFRRVMPLILTMRDESLFILESGVPVVPIRRLADFILNWEAQGSEILVLEPVEKQTMLRSG